MAGWLWHGADSVRRSVYVLAAFPLYALTYGWMKADARERGVSPPAGAIPLIAVLLPIAVPYYLLATRVRWGKLSGICRFMAYTVLVSSLAAIGEMLTDPSLAGPLSRLEFALLLVGLVLGVYYVPTRRGRTSGR